MIILYLDREKLNSIVKQVVIDSEVSRELVFIAGQNINQYSMMTIDNDDYMDRMQKTLDILGIKYDIEQENAPELNEKDIYRYSQEFLDECFANDRDLDREQAVNEFAYGN